MPRSLVVIGSGAVGVEFASIFKSFGAEVTILEALPRIVNVEDEDISKELLRLYKKRGIDVHISALRRKLGDDPKAPSFIRTVRAAGYLLINPEAPQ